MSLRPEFLILIFFLGLTSLACRLGGFWVMRFFTITPRLEAALKATPLAVMVGLVAPGIVHGGISEIVALVMIVIAMRMLKNDLLAAVVGVAVVAMGRSLA